MTRILNTNSVLPMPCVECGCTTETTINQLQHSGVVSCSRCGSDFKIDAQDFESAVERVEFLLRDIGRGLARGFQKVQAVQV